MTTPEPLQGIRDAFSSADFLASAEGLDQAQREAMPAAPAAPPKADRPSRTERTSAFVTRITATLPATRARTSRARSARPRASRTTRSAPVPQDQDQGQGQAAPPWSSRQPSRGLATRSIVSPSSNREASSLPALLGPACMAARFANAASIMSWPEGLDWL